MCTWSPDFASTSISEMHGPAILTAHGPACISHGRITVGCGIPGPSSGRSGLMIPGRGFTRLPGIPSRARGTIGMIRIGITAGPSTDTTARAGISMESSIRTGAMITGNPSWREGPLTAVRNMPPYRERAGFPGEPAMQAGAKPQSFRAGGMILLVGVWDREESAGPIPAKHPSTQPGM